MLYYYSDINFLPPNGKGSKKGGEGNLVFIGNMQAYTELIVLCGKPWGVLVNVQ